MTKKYLKKWFGFTFIELLVYVALLSIFVVGAIGFALNVINARQKSQTLITVDQEARFALERIAYEIRRAQSINSVSASSLTLNNSASVTTNISLSGTNISLSPDGGGPYNLNGNQVRVTSLAFTNLSSSGNNSQNIQVSITVEQIKTGVSASFEAKIELNSATELKRQFNQALKILVDASDVGLSTGNKFIETIHLYNSGASSIIIDQIYLSWTNTGGGINVTEIQINGGAAEWTGSATSGSTLNITDYTLAAGGTVDLNYLKFSSSMANAQVTLQFIFTDGSTAKSFFTLGSTSEITCNSYCTSLSYTAGTCRSTASVCSNNGETNVSGGDIYCAGGPSADTCCCAP